MTGPDTIATRLATGAPPGAPIGPLAFALKKLFEHDASLLEFGAHERAVSHRLAVYLEEALRGLEGPSRRLHVDCEYNRHDRRPKRVNGDLVYPDIVVHQRGDNGANLLAIELKLTTSAVCDDHDIAKLRGYRSQLHYEHALFLRLGAGDDELGIADARWIEADPCAASQLRPHASLADVVRAHVMETFYDLGGNLTQTAQALGISRVALRRRLVRYGVARRRRIARQSSLP